MSKYESLWNWIRENKNSDFQLTFEEIEKIIGEPLNHSFLNHKNELTEHGYQVQKISMKE